jgi:hypothetical protein
MTVYLFWAVVGMAAGLFCAVCEEGHRMCSDRRLKIQFTSLIIGYLIGTTIFGGQEPDGGLWIIGLAIQIGFTELFYRLFRGVISPLNPNKEKPKIGLVTMAIAILIPLALMGLGAYLYNRPRIEQDASAVQTSVDKSSARNPAPNMGQD